MAKYLIQTNNTLYTFDGTNFSVVSGSISAATFSTYGFNSLTGLNTALINSGFGTVKLLAWDNNQRVNMTAHLEGLPLPQDIIASDNIMEVTGISSITATYSGHPLVAVKVDTGNFLVYDTNSSTWVTAADHQGMEIADMQNISSEDWATIIAGSHLFTLRMTLTAETDSLSNITFVFTTS